jgi:hypothetical protein
MHCKSKSDYSVMPNFLVHQKFNADRLLLHQTHIIKILNASKTIS